MSFSNFTYSILSGAIETAVTPVISELIFSGEKDDDLGTYVRRVNTEMLFTKADYSYLYNNWEVSNECADLPFRIKYNDTTEYTGILRVGTSNLAWDKSNCKVTATVDPSGFWSCAESNWDREINLLNSSKVSVKPFIGTLETIECTDTDSVYSLRFIDTCLTAPSGSWTINRNECELIVSTYHYTSTYVRETATLACVSGVAVSPPGDGWVLLTDNCPTDSTWVRRPQTVIDNAASTIVEDESYDIYYDVVGGDYEEIDNAVLLADVLEDYLQCPGITVKSDFFGVNADSTYPSGDVYTSALENLQNIVVWQKSDVKRPDATENATKALWTYASILASLKEQCNVRWELSSDTLRLEHVSYFTGNQGMDLTSGANAQRIKGFDAYDTQTDDIARQERWSFMEDTTNAFRGNPIFYSECVPFDANDELPHDIGQVNNDIGYIQASPDRVSDDGFVFANTYSSTSGTYHLITEDSATGFGPIINAHMSIPNLLDNYHRHARPLPAGEMNEAAVTFESTTSKRVQVPVTIPMSVSSFFDWDENELIRTQLGWGAVERYEYNAKTCMLTLNLRHE